MQTAKYPNRDPSDHKRNLCYLPMVFVWLANRIISFSLFARDRPVHKWMRSRIIRVRSIGISCIAPHIRSIGDGVRASFYNPHAAIEKAFNKHCAIVCVCGVSSRSPTIYIYIRWSMLTFAGLQPLMRGLSASSPSPRGGRTIGYHRAWVRLCGGGRGCGDDRWRRYDPPVVRENV